MNFNLKKDITHNLNLTVSGLFVSIFLFVLFVIIWASNKGFDLTDEGYYLYSMQHYQDGSAFFEYQKILKVWFGWLDLKVIGFRVLRLVFTLFSSFVFAKGLFRLLLQKAAISEVILRNRIVYFVFILIASLLSYSIFPQTLSYNSLTLINVQFSSGLVLYAMSFEEAKLHYRVKSALLLAGTIVGFQNFVKFSNGILLVALLGSYLLFVSINKTGWKLRRNKLLWFICGVFLFLVYYSLSIGSLLDWNVRLQETFNHTETHSIASLFSRYFDTALTSIKSIFYNYYFIIPFLLIFHFLFRFIKTPGFVKNKGLIKDSVYSIVIGYIVFIAVKLSWHQSGEQFAYNAGNIYVLWLIIGLVMLVFSSKENKINVRPDLTLLFIGIFLFVLPLLCSFGTSNSLLVHILQYQFSWFSLMLLIAYKFSNKWKRFVYLFVIGGISCSQIISGLVYHPYRVNGTLFDQIVVISDLQPVKVDLKLKDHLENVNKVLEENGFVSDRSLLPIYCSPGLAYLLNASSPGSGWFSYSSSLSNCYNLQVGEKVDKKNLLFLLEAGKIIPDEFLSCLREHQIDFPGNYKKIGIVEGYTNKISVEIFAPQ